MLCSHCDMQRQPPERSLLGALLMHRSCTVAKEWHCAACWQQGVLLILLLVAPAVPTSVGFLFLLVGSAYGKMHLMGSCRRTWSAVEL